MATNEQITTPDSGSPASSGRPAAKPGEHIVDLSQIHDDDSAAAQMVGLFDPTIAAQETDAEEAPEAAAQEAPSGQTDDVETGEQAAPAITAPVSWTAEEKASFQKLPPEVQQTLLRRESEREQGIQTRLREAAEARTRYETLQQQAATERAQQANFLQGALLQLQPELQRLNGIDWAKLASENPAEWARQRQTFDDIQGRWAQAQQHLQGLQQQQSQQAEQQRRDFLVGEQQKLIAKLPEAADPVKGRALAQELTDFLMTEFGFTQQEVNNNLTDHRAILICRQAMLAAKAEKAKAAAQLKRVPTVQPGTNVRPLRPAARQGNEGNMQERTALHDNLVRTGSDRAAADLMASLGLFNSK